MSKSLSLAVTPSIKLRPSQASLYAFIKTSHDSGKTITINDVVKQYVAHGNRMVYNGTPHYYDYRNDKQVLDGEMLRYYAVQWFIRNLGIFVIKGLLTAIPTIELSQLEIESETNNAHSGEGIK